MSSAEVKISSRRAKSPLQEDIFLCRRIFSSARGDSPSMVEFSFREARRPAEREIVSFHPFAIDPAMICQRSFFFIHTRMNFRVPVN